MALICRKQKENVPGVVFIDDQCIYCGLCVEIAPNMFVKHAAEEFAFVYRQPNGQEELKACRDAAEGCPYDAIGFDLLGESM